MLCPIHVHKASIQPGDGVDEPKSAVDVVTSGLTKWANCFVEDNTAMWLLCVPCDVIVFGAPMWLRLPINHAVSFIWVCYLSFTRGDQHTEVAGVAAGADAESESPPTPALRQGNANAA